MGESATFLAGAFFAAGAGVAGCVWAGSLTSGTARSPEVEVGAAVFDGVLPGACVPGAAFSCLALRLVALANTEPATELAVSATSLPTAAVPLAWSTTFPAASTGCFKVLSAVSASLPTGFLRATSIPFVDDPG